MTLDRSYRFAMTYFPPNLLILMIALCLSGHPALGQERVQQPLAPASTQSCVLAGQEATFTYLPTDMRVADWQVEWSLVAGHRTLQRGGSQALPAPDRDVPGYKIKIPMPPLRDAVVLPVQLQIIWTADGKTYRHDRPLFIFARNPFAARQAFLEEAQIKLFEVDGKTAELLDEYEIPHSRLLNLSAIDRVTEGIVLVGEGASFREQQKLAESLLRAAQRGVPVLCLAPSEGDIPLMYSNRLVLERGEVVRRYDKRFDEIPTVCHFSLEPRRNEVVLSATNDQEGWSWLDMEFPEKSSEKPSGRLIVCGLGMVTPVPRYLFVRLLEELSRVPSTEEVQEDVFTEK